MENQPSFLDRIFHLRENGTTVRTEILAGITTFMTMAYILAVNPTIMSAAGMDKGAVLTAPALVIVGFLMLTSVVGIDFDDFSESIPAYITIIAMPFCYSISEGISFGIISYVFINVLTNKREKISLLMYILAVIFVLKYIFL